MKKAADQTIDVYKLMHQTSEDLLRYSKEDVEEQKKRADKAEEDNKCFRPKSNKTEHYNYKLQMV